MLKKSLLIRTCWQCHKICGVSVRSFGLGFFWGFLRREKKENPQYKITQLKGPIIFLSAPHPGADEGAGTVSCHQMFCIWALLCQTLCIPAWQFLCFMLSAPCLLITVAWVGFQSNFSPESSLRILAIPWNPSEQAVFWWCFACRA